MPNQITHAQERAIQHHKGACLVLAGPGSGKTFVITNRVVHMIRNLGITDEQILVITFTKAAAMEMEERFHRIMPEQHPWFGTFHSCFYYILKNSYTNIPNRFISTEEKYRILTDICEEVLGHEHDMRVEDVERYLSLYMNNGLSTQYMPEMADFKQEDLKAMFAKYHTALAQYGYMDFDDLMLCTYQLLKTQPDIRARFQKQFRYILIDECQDMNVLQYEIVKLLSGTEKNIFMVGDDDQSVYRFRGARVELMQRFLEEYKPVTQIQLDTNFRSTAEIVEKSLKVIEQNKQRFVKKVQAQNQEISGLHIQSFVLRHDMYEQMFSDFLKMEKEKLNSCAIIYRTNQELRSMAYKLRQKNIPYISKEDKKSIFDEDWYLDVEAYLRLGLGSLDRQYVLRVANKPNRFIKREQLVQIKKLPSPLDVAVKHIGTMKPYLAVKYIWSGIGYGRWLERELDMDTEKWDMVCEQYDEISQDMKRFASIEDWLQHVEEDRLCQKEQQKPQKTDAQEGVWLLTMHASKGLEFETVYLPDVNRGKVPKGAKLSAEEMEEERRLFYVAMTRAKKHLNIYYVCGTKDHTLQPSVFLNPILR